MAFTDHTWAFQEEATSANLNLLRDNFRLMGPHLIVRKTADESVTSSTTLQNDDSLLFAVGANEIWQFQFVLLYTGASAAGLKVAFTFPSGTFTANGPGLNAAGATFQQGYFGDSSSPTTSADYFCNSTTDPSTLVVTGVMINGATPGNVQLQWAQQTSNATATVVKTNSTLWAMKLA